MPEQGAVQGLQFCDSDDENMIGYDAEEEISFDGNEEEKDEELRKKF